MKKLKGKKRKLIKYTKRTVHKMDICFTSHWSKARCFRRVLDALMFTNNLSQTHTHEHKDRRMVCTIKSTKQYFSLGQLHLINGLWSLIFWCSERVDLWPTTTFDCLLPLESNFVFCTAGGNKTPQMTNIVLSIQVTRCMPFRICV